MKKILTETAKTILAIIFIFYLAIAVLSISIPAYKNIFVLVSCCSTILTLALCSTIVLIDFYRLNLFKKSYWAIDLIDRKKTIKRLLRNAKVLFKSLIQLFAFVSMLAVYVSYGINEFNVISLHFSYNALAFDFCTSLFSYLIIEKQNGASV